MTKANSRKIGETRTSGRTKKKKKQFSSDPNRKNNAGRPFPGKTDDKKGFDLQLETINSAPPFSAVHLNPPEVKGWATY